MTIVIVSVVVLQVAVFDQSFLMGYIRLDLPLYLAIGVGFVVRSEEAAVVGFVIGVASDMFQFGPFGLNALLLGLVGWSLAVLRDRVIESNTVFRTTHGALATAAFTAFLWFSAAVFGQEAPAFANQTLLRLVLVGAIGGVMVHPGTRLASFMVEVGSPDRYRGEDVNA